MVRLLGALALLLGIGAAGGWALGLRDLARVEATVQTLDLRDLAPGAAQDCFWIGPVTSVSLNMAFPDSGALYWPAVFLAPTEPGSYLEIAGTFPRARYLSLHSYLAGGVPFDRLSDADLRPDPGQGNPFATGPWTPGQTYKLRVRAGEPEVPRPANTLYAGPPGQADPAPLILRLYVPEGDADLPRVTLVRADGVTAVRAEDESGAFGVLPGHADLMTVLPPSVVPSVLVGVVNTAVELPASVSSRPSSPQAPSASGASRPKRQMER